MTLVPLFLYTLGFKIIGIGPASMILFLTPTSQFLLGITYFDEILTLEKFFGFVIIWIAVSIYLNELRKEWVVIITSGTIIATINEINSKFDKIIGLKFSTDIIFPTSKLDWKFWLGKNNNPELNPKIIDIKDNLVLIFFLKKP